MTRMRMHTWTGTWKVVVGIAQTAIVLVAAGGERAARAQDAAGPPPPPPGYTPAPVPPASYYYGQPPGAYPPPPSAYAPALPPGYHRHDGTYLRLQLGGGYSSFKVAPAGTSVAFSGGGFRFDVAVGGAVTENVVVFGEFFIAEADHPKVSGAGSGTLNGSLDLAGFGGGVAYYFPDINVYIAGTLAATKVSANDNANNLVGTSRWGFGVVGLVGKEWWVSSDWGLGVAAQLIAARMKDGSDIDPDATWTTLSAGLLFSATYN